MGRIGKFLGLTAGDWKKAMPMKKETFERTVKSKGELFDDRKEHIVRDYLAPLIREATYGYFAGATYRGGDRTEWVRLYLDDGVNVVDVDVTGTGSFTMVQLVVEQAVKTWRKQ